MPKRKRGRYFDSSSDDEDTLDDRNVPERTLTDLYCRMCDSHMNSEAMWAQHVAGKRHLKNLQKPPGEKPSKVKAVPYDAEPKVQEIIEAIEEPVVGLDYICETRRADPTVDPLYNCRLCQGTFTVMTIIEHLLSPKHRWNYLKIHCSSFKTMDQLKLNKDQMDAIVHQNVSELERDLGRGTMEVKIEKVCGMVPRAYSRSSPQPSCSYGPSSSRASKPSSKLVSGSSTSSSKQLEASTRLPLAAPSSSKLLTETNIASASSSLKQPAEESTKLPLDTPSTSFYSAPTPPPLPPRRKLDLKTIAKYMTPEQWNALLKAIEERVLGDPEAFRRDPDPRKFMYLSQYIRITTMKHLMFLYQKCTTASEEEMFIKSINEENLQRHREKEMERFSKAHDII